MFGRMGSEEEFRAPGGTDINIFSDFTVQFSFLPKFYKSCLSIPGDFTPRFWKMETGIPE